MAIKEQSDKAGIHSNFHIQEGRKTAALMSIFRGYPASKVQCAHKMWTSVWLLV